MYFNPLKKKTNSLTQAIFQFLVVGTLNDHPNQSDEMANMCAKYPIYLIRKEKPPFSQSGKGGGN